MTDARCPVCGGARIVCGRMTSGDSYAFGFVPNVTRWFSITGAVSVPGPHRSCLSCGLVWASLDPYKLREFMETKCGEITRQHLDEIDDGPYRDLPDSEWGRMIGDKVSELDALARGGSNGLIRRYRQMRGVTWDVAIKEASRWRRLTRTEKLMLFGWVPKTKPEKDDLGELL